MAANKQTNSKQLHNRLLASGAQPLVGLVSLHPFENNRDISPIDFCDDDSNSNNNNDNNNDNDDDKHTTYSVSYIKRQESSSSTSRRSILKNRYSEEHRCERNDNNDNNNSSSKKWTIRSNNKVSETEPMLMKVPIVSNQKILTTNPTASSLHQQQQQHQPQQERAIIIEKDYPDLEIASKQDNSSSSIPRSQSRISWNLDDDEEEETRAKELPINIKSSSVTNSQKEDMYPTSVPTNHINSSVMTSSAEINHRNQRSKNYKWTTHSNHQTKYRDYCPPGEMKMDNEDGSDDNDDTAIQYKPNHLSNLEPELDPEPVYVCRCCGLICELAPSMRYLHTFRMIFFVFNFLVFSFGIATMGMGLWYRIDPKVYELHKYIETQNFTIAGWIMLFAGFTVAITALIGFSGATKSRPGYLIYYFVMVAIITLLFMGSLVLVTVYGLGQSLERFATKEVFQQIQQKPFSDRSAQFLDFIQVKMKCCGATSFNDYARLGMSTPISCYAINKNYINAPGCGQALRELFDIRAGMAAGFCTGAVFVQLVAITIAAIMFCIIYHSRIPNNQDSRSRIAT